MKIYQVIDKVFYEYDGKDYQVADALTPITALSSKKKADATLQDFVEHYKKRGYIFKERNIFPMEHVTLTHCSQKKRVVIYINESEVK